MGHPRPTADQLSSRIQEARALLAELEDGVTIPIYDAQGRKTGTRRTPGYDGLVELVRAAERDGYGTSSPGSQGGSRSSVLDENGDPMPPVADPVGELVAGESVVDPIWHNLISLERGLGGCVGDLRMARSALANSFPQPESERGEPGCSSCARLPRPNFEPVSRVGRCDWCYRYWLAYSNDPPIALLVARREGRRITQRMIDTARTDRTGRARSKKRRRRSRAH